VCYYLHRAARDASATSLATAHRGVSALRYNDQALELKAVREADERLAGVLFLCRTARLRRLDKPFQAFFRHIPRWQKRGFTRYRAKSGFDSAEFRVGDGLTIRNNGRVGIVGIAGEIKVAPPFPADS
jgi:putative transposase